MGNSFKRKLKVSTFIWDSVAPKSLGLPTLVYIASTNEFLSRSSVRRTQAWTLHFKSVFQKTKMQTIARENLSGKQRKENLHHGRRQTQSSKFNRLCSWLLFSELRQCSTPEILKSVLTIDILRFLLQAILGNHSEHSQIPWEVKLAGGKEKLHVLLRCHPLTRRAMFYLR